MKQINSYIDSVFHTQDDLLEDVPSSIKENGIRSKWFNHHYNNHPKKSFFIW